MREKYNAIYPNSVSTEISYIQKYLGPELETILNPEANSIHGIDLDSIYVNMPILEQKMSPLKHNMDSDRCLFLTGLTGCGKSCLLDYTFHIESKGIHIENKSLYIPFSFDHTIVAREKSQVEKYFINQMKTACEIITKELEKRNLYPNSHNLYKYIEEVRHDALQYGDGLDRGTEEERLGMLCKEDPVEYYALTLKYYLTELKDINHVVLIVDDIESVGYQMELVPIDIGLSLWSCFKNQPRNTPKVWSSCAIISCRHYVYRMVQKHSIEDKYIIKSGIDSQTLESYPIDDEINISEPVKLINIIRKRVQALSRKEDTKRWNDAWAVVEHILIRVDDKFGDFVTAICINNIRKSLSVVKKVILNRRWIQRNWQCEGETPGAFNINNVEQYNLSPPCLLRAMGLGEGNTYDEDSIIPNIMFNTHDENSDLITLIVLKAFMNHSGERAIDWRTSLDRYKIMEDLKSVLLNQDKHPYVDAAVDFLIANRLFLRSKNQAQDDGLDINETNISYVKKIYVSRGAYALWNQLGRSSVLLELFSDDTFIDYREGVDEKQNFSLFDSKTFEKCIEFLSAMVELEKDIRIDARNAGISQKMNNILGSKFITWHLLNGLVMSRNAYYKTTDDYEKDLDRIAKKITDYTDLLRSSY